MSIMEMAMKMAGNMDMEKMIANNPIFQQLGADLRRTVEHFDRQQKAILANQARIEAKLDRLGACFDAAQEMHATTDAVILGDLEHV
jgi:hypothetical protein